MEPEVDINILVSVFTQKLLFAQKENIFLEAKYQSLLNEYNEVIKDKNNLQSELKERIK